jgi:hypothetical protein
MQIRAVDSELLNKDCNYNAYYLLQNGPGHHNSNLEATMPEQTFFVDTALSFSCNEQPLIVFGSMKLSRAC